MSVKYKGQRISVSSHKKINMLIEELQQMANDGWELDGMGLPHDIILKKERSPEEQSKLRKQLSWVDREMDRS